MLAMFVWLALVMLGLLIGAATAFLTLLFILPVIGYGIWHGCLETIDAGAFPRHAAGITSIPLEPER
jgi:uncharacterized membrane protein